MSDDLERINEVVAASANVLLRHVIPLFSVRPGERPELIGTSLLVERAVTQFLITARHVADHLLKPWSLSFYAARGPQRVVGRMLFMDDFDVAVIKLAPEQPVPGPDMRKLPLPFESLQAFQFPRERKQYLVTGFPQSRTKANPHTQVVKSQPQGFRLASAAPMQYESLGLTDQHHLVFGFDVKGMVFPDGKPRQVADPSGMSGSPLWLLFDEAEPDKPSTLPAVGVVIEHHRDKKLLVATDIAVAIHLINESD